MLELNGDLLRILGSQELIDLWWITQNRAFNFLTPTEVFHKKPEKVKNYLSSF